MRPITLYVIGNGFDLWHGIPSGLGAFKEYVLGTDRDIHREVEDYLPAGEDWCDLELALAELDADMLVDNLGHFMGPYGAEDCSDSGHHDFQYEVGNVVARLSTGLRKRFAEWIRALPIPTPDPAPRRLAKLDPKALFLSFNYTRTLSRLYGVDPARVLHIHGRADEADEELVLGHAWNPQSRRSLAERPDIEEIDTRLVEANDIIDDHFSATFKRSEAAPISIAHRLGRGCDRSSCRRAGDTRDGRRRSGPAPGTGCRAAPGRCAGALRHALGNRVPASVAGGVDASAKGRSIAARMALEAMGRHVLAVAARRSDKAGVERERGARGVSREVGGELVDIDREVPVGIQDVGISGRLQTQSFR